VRERVPQGRAGQPVERERAVHVLVREAGLLGEAPRGQEVAQPAAGTGLLRELDDLDEALARQPLEVEVRQADRDAEPLGEGALVSESASPMTVRIWR